MVNIIDSSSSSSSDLIAHQYSHTCLELLQSTRNKIHKIVRSQKTDDWSEYNEETC